MSNEDGSLPSALDIELQLLDLTVRTRNCCARERIITLGQLAEQTERNILGWQGAGRKTLKEIRALVSAHGLRLGEISRASDTRQTKQARSPPSIDLHTASITLKRKLIIRLIDLPLSTRAVKFMAKAKLTYLGDLLQLEESDVLRLPNSGRATLNEIRKLVQRFGLRLNIEIADWSRANARELELALAAELSADRKARSLEALNEAGTTPICLEAELERVVLTVEKGRNASLLLKLWGWAGDDPRTLDSVGQELGLTRERVRQLEARASKRLERFLFELPFTHSALNSLRRQAPSLHGPLEAMMRREGISRARFSISGLQHAARMFKLRWPFENVEIGKQQFLVLRSETARYERAIFTAKRKASEMGCTNLSWVAADSGLGENARGALRSLLDLVQSIEWLDTNKEWFYFRNSRNRLFNTCAKILGICPKIRLSELRRAASKSRRLGMAPPQQVLSRFVECSGLGTVDKNIVEANPTMVLAPAQDSAEGKLLKVLDEFGPVIDGDELAEKCVAAGMNAITFFIYRMGSPVIVSLGRGVYGKVGCDVPPGLVDQIADRKKRTRFFLDSGWNPAGNFWFCIQLSRIVIVGGSIRLPSSAAGIIHGEWLVCLPDGTDCGTVACSDQFIWRFRKAFLQLGAEPFDYAAFEFDTKARKVLLRVGGLEVIEAAQSPKASELEDSV
jgi:hypothetical protein